MSKVFETIIDIFQWIAIVLSPLLISSVIGVLVYLSYPGTTGIILFILFGLLGLIIGIIWATRVWKRYGTHSYMSRIMSSPEFDGIKKNPKDEKVANDK